MSRSKNIERPRFGPIINASLWLGSRSFTVQSLRAKLLSEGGPVREVAIVVRKGNTLLACLTHVTFERAVKTYGPLVGQWLSYYVDTGRGYRYPFDRVEIVDIVDMRDGQQYDKGITPDSKLRVYAFGSVFGV